MKWRFHHKARKTLLTAVICLALSQSVFAMPTGGKVVDGTVTGIVNGDFARTDLGVIYDLAIGNVVGSNIFNILMILGISTSIHPVALQPSAVYDCIILMVFSILVLFFCWSKKRLARGEGIFMIILYAFYTAYIILR